MWRYVCLLACHHCGVYAWVLVALGLVCGWLYVDVVQVSHGGFAQWYAIVYLSNELEAGRLRRQGFGGCGELGRVISGCHYVVCHWCTS